jgi:hypothetical protein
MDDRSYRKFYPDEWDAEQKARELVEVDTTTQAVSIQDVINKSFVNDALEFYDAQKQSEWEDEFNRMSLMKQDMVKRKLKKMIRKRRHNEFEHKMF